MDDGCWGIVKKTKERALLGCRLMCCLVGPEIIFVMPSRMRVAGARTHPLCFCPRHVFSFSFSSTPFLLPLFFICLSLSVSLRPFSARISFVVFPLDLDIDQSNCKPRHLHTHAMRIYYFECLSVSVCSAF